MMYYLDDHLGSTSIVTDRVGEVVSHVTYTPYGDMRDELNLGTSVNYLFTGQEFDREIGLYYYNARYYDQAVGRFISADTIIPEPSDTQSYNRYSYVSTTPSITTIRLAIRKKIMIMMRRSRIPLMCSRRYRHQKRIKIFP
jgi:RHS repeat-associated protein